MRIALYNLFHSAALLSSLRDYFDMIDTDAQGELDSKELLVAIAALGEVQ
jgi:Ca2+-binding EF-hand superfamily protein